MSEEENMNLRILHTLIYLFFLKAVIIYLNSQLF